MAAPLTLDGRSALVTGGGRGIGKRIALALAGAGCRVAINYYVEPELAEATVQELSALGVEAFAVEADVGVPADVRGMVDAVVKRFGRLDVLVNNAGVQTWTPFLEVREEEWDLVIRTNLKGCFLCTQAAALHMKDYGGGAIVNIGSGSNKVPFPGLVAYTASKGGIEMLTKVAAVELAPHGIRVNSVCPGYVATPMQGRELSWEAELRGTTIDAVRQAWIDDTPLGRLEEPQDVARVVAFLAGPDSAFLTGESIAVNGGAFMD